MENRDVELVDYFRILWRQKAVIAVAFLATTLSAWFVDSQLPRTYSTKLSLLLLPPLANELNVTASGSTLTSQVCQRIAVSTEILDAVATNIGLPPDKSSQALSRRISISVQSFAMSGEQQFVLDASFKASDPGTSEQMAQAWIMAFSKMYGELFQDRTARSFDYISENAAATHKDLETALAKRTELLLAHPIDLLKSDIAALQTRCQSDVARLEALRREFESNEARIAALEDALAKKTALLLEHPIGLLTSEIEALQLRYQGDAAELASLKRELDSNEARIAALENELSHQTSVLVLERSLEPDSLAIALQSGLSSRAFGELLDLRAQAETENPTFMTLTTEAAYARVRGAELANKIETLTAALARDLADLTARQAEATTTQAALTALEGEMRLLAGNRSRAELTDEIQTLTAAVTGELAALGAKQEELVETQAALDALDSEVELLQSSYERLAAKLQEARIALAERSGPIRVIDAPSEPTQSVGPGTGGKLLISGFLGLLVGVGLAFLFDYLQRVRGLAPNGKAAKIL